MNHWLLVVTIIAVVVADAINVHQRVEHLRRQMRKLVADLAAIRRELGHEFKAMGDAVARELY